MLLYITDSKKTKHAVRVEGIESIAFTNNPAIITFNYLNGSKKELHMVEQDLKVPSDAYVVDKLWAWVNAGLSDKPKQLTSFLGRKAKVETVKSVETDEEHSENKTYLRISKFHDSFVEKKVIPVDDITSVTAHSEESHDYLLFTTKHKKYKLVLVYTYSDVYASDINDNKHAANLIKDDIIDLIQKSKNKGVVTYNPIEFISFSYEQPYGDDGYIFRSGFESTWNLEEVFDFTENYDEIQIGKKQDACLYAFNMYDVIANACGPIALNNRGNGHTYKIRNKSFIQLGSTRSEVYNSTITNVEIMPPLGFTYDLLGHENLEGTGKWLGSWAPSKAYYSIGNKVADENGVTVYSNPIVDNPTLDDVFIKPNIDIDNKIPALTNWGLHSLTYDEAGNASKFLTFWDEQAEQYKDIPVPDGVSNKFFYLSEQDGAAVTSTIKDFDLFPNVFNPVYGMLCKEDGVYKVSVNFEDIILSKTSSVDSQNHFLTPDERNNVEAYLTIKVYEAHTPFSVLNNGWTFGTQAPEESNREDSDFPVREQYYGPFPASERGFNIKSDFIIPGVKNSTFFKFLLTIVNKSETQDIYAHIDTKLELPTQTRNIFGTTPNIGFSREAAIGDFTSSALTQTWRYLDDDSLPYNAPVNAHSTSILHIEKIAELPTREDLNKVWMSTTSTSETTGSPITVKSLKGTSRTETETASGYYYSSDGIGTGNL